MTRDRLAALTKRELAQRARAAGIPGRSGMTKAELVAALAAREPEPATPDERRSALADRLAGFSDPGRRCPWHSIEGHRCGLPAVAGHPSCALHGGADIHDLAIPIAGESGVHTWPLLLRQLWLATYEIDPFGLDPVVAEIVWYLLNGLYFEYFKVTVEGIENVPLDGPAVLVGNHGGAALPYDGVMLPLAVMNEADRPRRVRVLGTEIFNMLPALSHLYRKAGFAYASREDARALLERGHLVGVFPEGERGFMKPVSDLYRVQRFGRGGFVGSAAVAKAPIVPVAIIGSEEVHPAVGASTRLARLVRLLLPEQRVDKVAVFLNPVPLPVRWRIRFLPPITPASTAHPDPLELLEVAEHTRATIQHNLDEMLAERTGIF